MSLHEAGASRSMVVGKTCVLAAFCLKTGKSRESNRGSCTCDESDEDRRPGARSKKATGRGRMRFGKAVSATGGVTYAFTDGTVETQQKEFVLGAWRCAALGQDSISRGRVRGCAGGSRKFLPLAIEAESPTNTKYNPSADILLTLSPWYLWDCHSKGVTCRPTHGGWGRTSMTRILRLNHQLASEAIDVIYNGDFTFRLPTRFCENNVNTWLSTIGEKRNLIKRIGICIEADLHLITCPGPSSDQRGRKRGSLLLREQLESLKNVEIRVMLFESNLERGQEDEEILRYMIRDLMGVFRGLATVVADEALVDGEMRRLIEGCNER
ncbi:hypothetical protein N431DRAFT_559402 [Stipitochalara longipes BDJ]|nr:hypothetical protein N431DRAFT_559402 [Stipitochalara longipes BDJ]